MLTAFAGFEGCYEDSVASQQFSVIMPTIDHSLMRLDTCVDRCSAYNYT